MSSVNGEVGQTAPRPGRSFVRFWLPFVIAAVGIVGLTLLWTLPSADFPRVFQVIFTVVIGGLAVIGLLVWALILSGWRRSVRLGLLGALVVAGLAFAGSVSSVHFTGDLEPIFTYRWSPVAERSEAEGQTVAVPAARPTDFPAYRGTDRDGVVVGPPLARDWGDGSDRQLWRVDVGEGLSSVAVVEPVAITQEQWGGKEEVTCYDTASGRKLWSYAYEASFSEPLGGPGPRATPTIVGDRVYSMGATGHLSCLNVADGKLVWKAEVLEDNANIKWAMSASPLVYGRFVVVVPGRQKEGAPVGTVAAYDRDTGKLAWTAGDAPAGYSSPQLATLAGTPQVLVFDGKGIAGYDAEKGTRLWRYPWVTNEDINVAQPLVFEGDRVLVSSGYGVGSALLQIKKSEAGEWSAEPLWKNTKLRCRFTSPVAYQGHVYGLDEGRLVCLDVATGERKWRGENLGHGQLLLSDNVLLIQAENGELWLVEATPEEFRPLSRIEVFGERTWNYPALANGRAYLRNHKKMACYDLRAK